MNGARRVLPAVLGTVACVMLGLVLQSEQPAFAGDPWWESDYDQALAKAKETGKPILLEFR